MFFSNNFLFLISLAFISWAILCYLNKIDESRDLQYHLEYNLEKSFNDALITEAPSFMRNYQAYINFFCIFTSIYIFAKLTTWIEDFFSFQERAKSTTIFPKNDGIGGGDGLCFDTVKHSTRGRNAVKALQMSEATFSIDDYRKLTESLREEIAKMQKRIEYLEQRARELEQHNLLLMGKGILRARNAELRCDDNGFVVITTNSTTENGDCNMTDVEKNEDSNVIPLHVASDVTDHKGVSLGCTGIVCTYFCYDGEGEEDEVVIGGNSEDENSLNGSIMSIVSKQSNRRNPKQQNIFIANRFFHLNRQVYVNEGSVKLSFQGYDGGDFTQIWQKYLDMQRSSYRMPKKSETTTRAPTPTCSSASSNEENIEPTNTVDTKDSETIPPFTSAADMFSPEVSLGRGNATYEAPIVVSTEELETMLGLVQ